MTRIEPSDICTKPMLDMEKWWMENGYTATVYKRLKSKKVYTVTKGSVTMKFEILNSETDPAKTLENFQRRFEAYSIADND